MLHIIATLPFERNACLMHNNFSAYCALVWDEVDRMVVKLSSRVHICAPVMWKLPPYQKGSSLTDSVFKAFSVTNLRIAQRHGIRLIVAFSDSRPSIHLNLQP